MEIHSSLSLCTLQEDSSAVVAMETGKADDTSSKAPSYVDYIQLWLELLDPRELRVRTVVWEGEGKRGGREWLMCVQ